MKDGDTLRGMKYLMFLFVLFLASCANFTGTNQSIWSEGMWIIPTLTGAGALWFLYVAYRASKSGSQGYDKVLKKYTYDNKNIPIYKVAQFIYFVALTLATIGIIIWQYSER